MIGLGVQFFVSVLCRFFELLGYVDSLNKLAVFVINVLKFVSQNSSISIISGPDYGSGFPALWHVQRFSTAHGPS